MLTNTTGHIRLNNEYFDRLVSELGSEATLLQQDFAAL